MNRNNRHAIDDRLIEDQAATIGAMRVAKHTRRPEALPSFACIRMRAVNCAARGPAVRARRIHRLAQLRHRHDMATGGTFAARALRGAGAVSERKLHRTVSSDRIERALRRV